jgi:ABC-2 type transport system permease protein
MLGWKGFFDVFAPPGKSAVVGSIDNLPAVLRSAGVLLAHIVIFVSAAMYVFRKKDVLS